MRKRFGRPSVLESRRARCAGCGTDEGLFLSCDELGVSYCLSCASKIPDLQPVIADLRSHLDEQLRQLDVKLRRDSGA